MAQWRKVSMREAIIFIRDDCGQPVDKLEKWMSDVPLPNTNRYGYPDVEWFDNGMAVGCASDWEGPWGEVTPDIDAKQPEWFIYC